MKESQKIRVRVEKIYNWTHSVTPVHLTINFYSKSSQHLITSKQIETKPQSQHLPIGISLNISYPSTQSIIIMSIKQQGPNPLDYGQLQVDLQQLKATGSKYIAFYGFQKIMHIVTGDTNHQHQNPISIQERRVRNKLYIQDRRSFLEMYKRNQEILRNQFEEKISMVLGNDRNRQHHTMIHRRHHTISEQPIPNLPQYCQDESQKDYNNETPPTQLQELITRSGQLQKKLPLCPCSSPTPQLQSPPPACSSYCSSSRKHKLILNTLNIVEKDTHME